jgi:DivIVA domain-containing protein
MPAVDFDRQSIERRDFPIGRRGYDPAAVDAHLRALADDYEELQRAAITGGGDASVASTAGTQVQSILQAAETAAAEIERHALENARQVREDADRAADRTREEAVERARQHVAAVAQVTARLLEHVGSMDGEVSALVESMRAGAGRLAADLSAVETGMSELYDAASGRAGAAVEPEPPLQFEPEPRQFEPEPRPFERELDSALQDAPQPVGATIQAGAQEAGAAGGDLDGARLIALNMALNGESRADTERYLAENFQLPDRLKLIDEVYSAIEG